MLRRSVGKVLDSNISIFTWYENGGKGPFSNGGPEKKFQPPKNTLYHVGIYWGPYPLLKGSNRGG